LIDRSVYVKLSSVNSGGTPRRTTEVNSAANDRAGRRSQAERSAYTRERVVQAVTDLIADEGIASATASRISSRAGVTWGAIAHQFGDKDSVLLAVAEHGFAQLSRSLTEGLDDGAAPRERMDVLIDETWRRLNTPSSLAFLEIVLNARNLDHGELRSRQEALVVTHTRQIWSDLFGEFDVDEKAIDTARKLTFATLLGMSIQNRLGPHKPRFSHEIETLKRMALNLLGLANE
jgi:AcrR family transcriptional regulator